MVFPHSYADMSKKSRKNHRCVSFIDNLP